MKSSSNIDCDQDSDVSFENDTDEEIDTAEIEEEDWIECMKRSTATATERMQAARIPCWIETHRRMIWRLAMGIASLPDERLAKKAPEWNPSLSIKIKTCRSVGRSEKKIGSSWQKNRERWKEMGGAGHSPRTRLTLIGWPIPTRRFPCRRGKAYRRSPRSLPCLRSKAFTKDQTVFDTLANTDKERKVLKGSRA